MKTPSWNPITTAAAVLALLVWLPASALGAPPTITLVTPTPIEVDEGGDLDLEVSVSDPDGDPVDVYWELTDDGAFDDGTGLTATFSAIGFDGPTEVTAQARAQDATEQTVLDITITINNAAPVFTSNPSVDPGLDAYRGMEWSYQLEVDDPANADGIVRDPVIVTVPIKPEGMIYFGDQHFEWTPRDSDVGTHDVRIEADDRDVEEPAVQEFTIRVLANAPPTSPTIVSPTMTTVYVSRPDLVIMNSTDPDGDLLTYTFEVNTVGDFSPASRVATCRVFEGTDGQTVCSLTTDLMDGGRYYWRVWANDGSADSDPVDTFFDVSIVPLPDEDTDASTDVVTDTPWIPPQPNDGTCGCSTLPGRSGGLAVVLIGLALAALLARRRLR